LPFEIWNSDVDFQLVEFRKYYSLEGKNKWLVFTSNLNLNLTLNLVLLEFLLHDLHFNEIGGSGNADGDSSDDDDLISWSSHSQLFWHFLRPL